MGIFSRFLPKKKPVVIQNNTPKEKDTIRKMFGAYCQSKHKTESKLCPKCTALLATILLKMNRCPYGITKPLCNKCDLQCFGPAQTKQFLEVMDSAQKKMFLKHPIMAIKHKFHGWQIDMAKARQARDKEKAEKEKAKAKEKK